MIRHALLLMLGPAIILFAAAFVVMHVMPAHGAEPRCNPGEVRVSYYGKESCIGKARCQTASGRRFDGTQLLVAHKTLPFGTMVRFTYRGRSIVVPVLDRGPYIKGRDWDLSREAARRLGMIPAGVACVSVEQLSGSR